MEIFLKKYIDEFELVYIRIIEHFFSAKLLKHYFNLKFLDLNGSQF